MSQQRFNSIMKSNLSPMMMKNQSKEKSNPSCNLNDLQFSIDTITFRYRGNHSQYLYNRELRLKNRTGTRIYFKIKSNSPQNYQVLPFEEFLESGKSLQIRFKLNVTGTNINKYNVDRFRVQWGRYEQSETKYVLTESYILKVRMETETVTSQRQIGQELKERHGSDQEKVFKDMLEKNLKQIKKTNQKIEKLEQQNTKQVEFSKTLFIFVALFAFLLGFYIG